MSTIAEQLQDYIDVVNAREAARVEDALRSRADVGAYTPPALVQAIRTGGYYANGDGGGAVYKRVLAEPAHPGKVQSLGGVWWELAEVGPSVLMFGIKKDGTSQTAAFVALLTALGAASYKAELRVPTGVVFDLDTVRDAVPAGIQVRDERELGSGSFDNDLSTRRWVVPGGTAIPAVRLRPILIEQFLTTDFGRGMTDDEAVNLYTEQTATTVQAAGDKLLGVSDNSLLDTGGKIVIRYGNGQYRSHFVTSKGPGDTISIEPGLWFALAGGEALERKWYNPAHPGKFGMREVAQRIAHITELEGAVPEGRRHMYLDFATATGANAVTALGTAAVTTLRTAANMGSTDTLASIVRYPFDSIYVAFSTDGDCFETELFDVPNGGPGVCKFAFMSNSSSAQFAMELVTDTDVLVGRFEIPTNAQRVPQEYTMTYHLRGGTQLRARLGVVDIGAGADYFTCSYIDAFPAPEFTGPAFAQRDGSLLVVSHSWGFGDLVNSLEREPFLTQLRLELPYMKIIDASIFGETIVDFEERLLPLLQQHRPTYTLFTPGPNDVYQPGSSVFDPNSLVEYRARYFSMINMIQNAGSRPIILGEPGMAQSDPDVPFLVDGVTPTPAFHWNDRIRKYRRYMQGAFAGAAVLA